MGWEQCEGLEIPFGHGDQANICLQQGKNHRARSRDTSRQQPPAKAPQHGGLQ